MESQVHSNQLPFFVEWVAVNVASFAALNIIVLPALAIVLNIIGLFGLYQPTSAWIILLTASSFVVGGLQWRVIRKFVGQPSKLWILSAILSSVIAGSTLFSINLFGNAYTGEITPAAGLNLFTRFGIWLGLISSLLPLGLIRMQSYRMPFWILGNALIGVTATWAGVLASQISQFVIGPVAGILVGLLSGALLLWVLEDHFKEPVKV